jgi:hypothetical protein
MLKHLIFAIDESRNSGGVACRLEICVTLLIGYENIL